MTHDAGSPDRAVMVQRDDVLWRQLDDQVLVLDVPRSRYLRLNRSGSVLWQALTTPRTTADLVDVLVRTYDLDDQRARADVAAFLSALSERGLLQEVA